MRPDNRFAKTGTSSSPRCSTRYAQLLEAIVTVAGYFAVVGFLFSNVLMRRQTLISNGDSADQSFMWLSKIFAAVQHGSLALWDFDVNSGTSFIGEMQTSPLYPPALLFGLFAHPGDPHAFDFFLILHFLVAALGFHVLCRTLELDRAACLLGALIFAFGSGIALRVNGQPNLFASLVWFPWVAVAAQWSLRSTNLVDGVAFAAVGGAFLALSVLAGHVHGPVLIVVGTAFLAPASFGPNIGALRKPSNLVRLLVSFAVIIVVAIGLALPQLVATTEYLKLAYKWYGAGYTAFPHVVPYEVFLAHGLQPRDPSTLFTGNTVSGDGGTLYVTLTGLVCIVIAYVGVSVSRRYLLLTLCATAIALCGLTLAFASIPAFGWFYYHVPFINLVRVPSRGLFLFTFGGALLAAIGVSSVGCVIDQIRLRDESSQLATLSVTISAALVVLCFAEVALWLPKRIGRPLSGPGIELEAILNGPAVTDLLLRSRNGPLVYRFFADRSLVPPNIGDFYPLLSAHGYRSTRTIAYHTYFDFNPQSARMDRLGVKWWLDSKPIASLPLVATIGTTFVYERPTALPVFWLADGTDRGRPAPTETVNWRQNEVGVTFSRAITGRLVFAQTDFPGWTARADGLPVEVFEFENLLAIDLPGPSRHVIFRYSPAWWMPTVTVSLATLAFVLGAILVAKQRRSGAEPVHADCASSDCTERRERKRICASHLSILRRSWSTRSSAHPDFF